MGFFDKFRKKEQISRETKEPETSFDLKYSSGDVATVTFRGTVEVEGKILHNVIVTYTAPDSTFRQKKVLLEPMYQGENDVTESYYQSLASIPNENSTPEQRKHFNDVKGFFKKQQVETLESDYLGALAYDSQGVPHREYDNDFRTKYAEIYRAEKQAQQEARDNAYAEREEQAIRERNAIMQKGIQQQLAAQINNDPNAYDEVGNAGHLTRDDYEKYFGNR